MTPCEYILENVKMKDLLAYYGITPNNRNEYLCPFHNDHHPSGKVRDNYWFSCFPCQINYNVIHFVCAYEHCSKSQAKAKLDNMFNLGLGFRLTEQQQEEIKIAKRLQEKKKKEQELFNYKEKLVLNNIITELRFWEFVENIAINAGGKVDENIRMDNIFLATQKQLWLNWLYEKCCGLTTLYIRTDFDIQYKNFTSKDMVENIYENKIII